MILASAPGPLALERISSQLGSKLLYIGLNGALIVDGDAVIYEQAIPAPGAEEALRLVRQFGLSINAYAGRRWVIESENPYSAQEAEIVGAQPELADLGSLSKIHKIPVIGRAEDVNLYQEELLACSPLLNVSVSKPTYCEIVSSEVSKGRALKRACHYLGIDPSAAVAFGDGENDLELMAAAGIAVAMGNSHPALLAEADFVSSSHDEDGILLGVRWVLGLAKDD